MHRLFSRTSITIDEAVANLLGLFDGPIKFRLKGVNEETEGCSDEVEANRPAFCLRETLEDELEVLEGEYLLAKHDEQQAGDIAEKLAALQRHQATVDQANGYLCAIEDELNKGEQSMLKVDRALSNAAYTYITWHSFTEWVKCREAAAAQHSGAAEHAGSLPAGPEEATQPKSRIRLREQEKAILIVISKHEWSPLALPRSAPGRPGVKATVREALRKSPLFEGRTTFDKAWERLIKDGRIAYEA